MTDTDSEIDLQLQWEDETQERRATLEDCVTFGDSEPSESAVVGAPKRAEPGGVGLVEAEKPQNAYIEDEDDDFEWTEEREAALEAALEEAPTGSVPRVQLQLTLISSALEADDLGGEEATRLLKEVEDYLRKRLARESAKPSVDNELYTRSSRDKVNGLSAYLEATRALQEYVNDLDPLQLKVAHYALEQGGSFLNSATELIMACEPEEEEEEPETSEEPEPPEEDEEWDEDEEEDD